MKGFVVVRTWPAKPWQFLTPHDGWSANFENALLFPTEEAAQRKLRGRPGEIRPASDFEGQES